MIRFKEFLKEAYVRPQFGIDEPTRIQSPIKDRPLSIFTQSAGYGRDWGLDRGYNPRGDALVHTTEFFPKGGVIQTRGSAEAGIPIENWGVTPLTGRETVHFTRNGLVSSHLAGNFEGRPFTVVAPQGPLASRLMAHADQDSWVLGNVEVPHGSTVLVHEPALTPQHKENLAKMFGVDNYEQIQQKLQKGSNLDFNGRQIEIKSTKGDMKGAVEAQLRSVGVEPLDIGSNYAVGVVDKRPTEKLPKEFRYSWNDGRDWFSKSTKERIGALDSPFNTSPHIESGFGSAERLSSPPVPFESQDPLTDWRVPKKSLEDLVSPRIQEMGRELHPEETSAFERNKNWRSKLQQWIESKQKEYSADPKAFREKIEIAKYGSPIQKQSSGVALDSELARNTGTSIGSIAKSLGSAIKSPGGAGILGIVAGEIAKPAIEKSGATDWLADKLTPLVPDWALGSSPAEKVRERADQLTQETELTGGKPLSTMMTGMTNPMSGTKIGDSEEDEQAMRIVRERQKSKSK